MRVVLLAYILVAVTAASLQWGSIYNSNGYDGNNQYVGGYGRDNYFPTRYGYHPKYIESPFYKPDYYSREHRRRHRGSSSSESHSDSDEVEIIVPNPGPPVVC